MISVQEQTMSMGVATLREAHMKLNVVDDDIVVNPNPKVVADENPKPNSNQSHSSNPRLAQLDKIHTQLKGKTPMFLAKNIDKVLEVPKRQLSLSFLKKLIEECAKG